MDRKRRCTGQRCGMRTRTMAIAGFAQYTGAVSRRIALIRGVEHAQRHARRRCYRGATTQAIGHAQRAAGQLDQQDQ